MPTISPSRIGTLNHCARKHYYNYMFNGTGLQSLSSSTAMDAGTAIHSSLENLYQGKPVVNLDPSLGDVAARHNAAVNMYGVFAAMRDNDFDEVLGTEVPFEVPLEERPGWKMKGIIDLVVRIKGEIWIADHKSTGMMWPIEQIGLSFQPKMYELAATELYGEPVAGSFYNFILLRAKGGEYTANVTRTFLPMKEEGLATVYDEVLDAVDRIERGDKQRNVGSHCKWCSFFNLCQGEYFGQDISGLVTADFVPKESSNVILIDE